ncbi:MAG: thioredoxin domain-containing protein, partial [Phycisphaerales bacterium]|nr:thioredoxin domain-containing protein [Phycisphaerales bacterium]
MQSKRSWRLFGFSAFALVAVGVAGALLLQQETASIDDRQGASNSAMQPSNVEQGSETASRSASDRPAGHAGGENANRLINTTSPYLLQHAYNPVDWYPWGEEALARAKAEHKPIFLSVGYSTCYWCHVMEREVFENPEIAALMNQLFVNVKVDRE